MVNLSKGDLISTDVIMFHTQLQLGCFCTNQHDAAVGKT